jgi:predicted nuclease of predicted toxin-antitoxin system
MPWVDASSVYSENPASEDEIAQLMDYSRRRAKPRFYADENFPTVAVELLRSRGAKVVTAKEVRRRGHPDENHAAYALKHKYILVTCDRDYLDNRRFPLVHCPVIVVFDFGTGSTAEMRRAFICLWTAFKVPQFWDKWMKIDANPDSWTQQTRHLDGTASRSRHRWHQGSFQEWRPAKA